MPDGRWWRRAALLSLLLGVCLAQPRLAEAAERVLALSPHLAELSCAAGACERLVARVEYSDYPAAVLRLPEIGSAYALNPEAVLAVNPDLVLAWRGGTPAETVGRLRALGLHVAWVDIAGIEQIADAIEHIGSLVGTPIPAAASAHALRLRTAAMRAQYAQREPVRVLYQIELNPMFSISRRSPIHDAIGMCGGVNVFAELPGVAAVVSDEAAVASAPEVVVFAAQDGEASIHRWWQDFADVPAVANGHLYSLNADLMSRATPRMIDGVAQLCERIDRVRRARSSAR